MLYVRRTYFWATGLFILYIYIYIRLGFMQTWKKGGRGRGGEGEGGKEWAAKDKNSTNQ